MRGIRKTTERIVDEHTASRQKLGREKATLTHVLLQKKSFQHCDLVLHLNYC